jgi:hypothetical protein
MCNAVLLDILLETVKSDTSSAYMLRLYLSPGVYIYNTDTWFRTQPISCNYVASPFSIILSVLTCKLICSTFPHSCPRLHIVLPPLFIHWCEFSSMHVCEFDWFSYSLTELAGKSFYITCVRHVVRDRHILTSPYRLPNVKWPFVVLDHKIRGPVES